MGIRCTKYFERWLGSAINDSKKLSQIMIMDQILTNTTPELQIWLREHEARTVDKTC